MNVPSGLHAWYTAASFNLSANVWADVSGNQRDGTTSGGGFSVGAVAGFGSVAGSVPYVQGATTASVVTLAAMPAAYSICTLSRYGGTTVNKRIFSGRNANLLHGHWNGAAGWAYYGTTYLTALCVQPACGNSANWVSACTAMSASLCNYVVNGLYVPCIANVAPPAIANLVINTGLSMAEATAGWQVSEAIIWNRQLSVAELMGVHQFWAYSYALDAFSGKCLGAAAHRFLPTVVPGVTNVSASPTADSGAAAAPWSLTAYGGVTYEATGGSLLFNGVSGSYASFGTVALAGGSLSFALWVRYDAFQSGSERVYELATGASGGTALISMGTYPATYIRASMISGAATAGCQAPSAWTAATWTHVVAVYSAVTSTTTMYVNGVFACRTMTAGAASAALSATFPAAYAALGKSSWAADKWFHGAMTDVRVHTTALTASDVAALFAAAGACTAPPPLASPPAVQNLAPTGTASSSSQYVNGAYSYAPQCGNDGGFVCDYNGYNGPMAVTMSELGWWMVDLGAQYFIDEVALFGRYTSLYVSQSANLQLRIGNSSASGGAANPACTTDLIAAPYTGAGACGGPPAPAAGAPAAQRMLLANEGAHVALSPPCPRRRCQASCATWRGATCQF
jgi:hypothetical protein